MRTVTGGLFTLMLFSVTVLGRGAMLDHAPLLKQIEVNGTQLHYVEMGEGEPIVFVHGALGDYRNWTGQLAPLSERYRVVAYSRRYHHPNAWAADGPTYSRALHAQDLVALIEALDLGPVHLVGHSYGAALAVYAAVQRPELVRTLVLGEPSLFTLVQSPQGKAMVTAQQAAFDEVLGLLRGGETDLALREYLKAVVGADVFDQLPPEGRAVIVDNLATLQPTLATFFRFPPFGCDDAGKLSTPTLLVTGSLSPPLYGHVVGELDRCLPNSSVFVLDDASHGLQLQKPIEFNNEAVLKFLAGS